MILNKKLSHFTKFELINYNESKIFDINNAVFFKLFFSECPR